MRVDDGSFYFGEGKVGFTKALATYFLLIILASCGGGSDSGGGDDEGDYKYSISLPAQTSLAKGPVSIPGIFTNVGQDTIAINCNSATEAGIPGDTKSYCTIDCFDDSLRDTVLAPGESVSFTAFEGEIISDLRTYVGEEFYLIMFCGSDGGAKWDMSMIEEYKVRSEWVQAVVDTSWSTVIMNYR